jgi:long-chain acyl-CoA synthetase
MDQARLITRSARFFSDKTAVVFENKRLTFREVNERANRLANGLRRLGIGKGEMVATLRRDCAEHAELFFGLIKGGYVEITLNPSLNASEISWQIKEPSASIVIFQKGFAELIESISNDVPSVKQFICIDGELPGAVSYEELLAGASPEEPAVALDPDDLAELRYTSGTTGKPKGIMLPLRSGLCVTRNLLLDMIPDLTPRDTFLALQPLYHGAGWFVLPCWVRGVTQVYVPRYDPEIAIDVIEREGVSVIKTVPTVLVRLLAHQDLGKHRLGNIRTIIYGASPMPVERLREGLHLFGSVFVQLYGQTEAPMTLTVLRKEEHIVDGSEQEVRRLSSAGRPCTFVDLKIVDKEGAEVKPGEEGEVIVNCDHVMTGYLNREEETREALRDGWLYTGDMGVYDGDGYVYLVGRKGDMIISGGLNVYPNEVEQVLYVHPAVKEAAVIGVPDQVWGETIKACVVLKGGENVTEEEIVNFCKERLSSYKKPRSVDFLDELPKNAMGKIVRRELLRNYQ